MNKSKRGKITKDEDFERLKSILNILKNKYNKNKKEILDLIEDIDVIPVSIFDNGKLSISEAITKYFVEEKGYRYSKIAKIIKRDQRTVWNFYNKAKKKVKGRLNVKDSRLIPISIFTKKSLLETVALYLRDNFDLSYHEIAILLRRDDRTIWTVCNRKEK